MVTCLPGKVEARTHTLEEEDFSYLPGALSDALLFLGEYSGGREA